MSTGMTLPYFLEQFTDNAGRPLSGGSLTFLVAGSTSLPKPVYLDIALQNEAPNPLPLDGSGRAPQYFAEAGAYKVVVKASTGTIEATRDYVEGVGGSGPATGDHKVIVSGADTTPGYLHEKTIAGGAIQLDDVDMGGGNRKLGISINEALLHVPPYGPASGDLAGFYPDPIVEQLTGVAASLLPIASDFTTTTTPKNTAIAFGKQYFAGVEVPCWMATDFAGNIRWTRDEWATTAADTGLALRGIGANWNCARFLYLPALASWAWVLGDGLHQAFYYALHNAGAYNANGTIKSAQWTALPVANGPSNVGDIAQGLNDVICWVGNSSIIGRTTDFSTFASQKFCTNNAGGIDTDTNGNWLAILRDTGELVESTDNGVTWATKAALFINGSSSSVPSLPIDGDAKWGSLNYGYGIWLAAVYNANSSTPTYAYSYDRLNWEVYYAGTSESFFSSAFNGVKWFATNPNAGNPIWQLLVAEIPAHKKLIAEKGLVVAGQTFLPDLTNAQILGTDKNGLLSKRDSLALTGSIACLNLVANGNIATPMVNTQSYQVNGTETIDSSRNVKAASLWSGGAIRVDANGDFTGRNQMLTGWLTVGGSARLGWGGVASGATQISSSSGFYASGSAIRWTRGLYFDGSNFINTSTEYAQIFRLDADGSVVIAMQNNVPVAGGIANMSAKWTINRFGGMSAFGVIPPTARPTISGQRTATATLAALYAALSATGLILDSTTGSSVTREAIIQPLPITNAAPGTVTIAGGVKSFGFDGGASTEELFYHCDVQHDYIAGGDLTFHVHWLPDTGAGGSVKWQIEYMWVEAGGVWTTATALSATTSAGTVAKADLRTDITISGTGRTYNSRIIIRLFRNPADGADTYGGDAILSSVGMHYQADPGQP